MHKLIFLALMALPLHLLISGLSVSWLSLAIVPTVQLTPETNSSLQLIWEKIASRDEQPGECMRSRTCKS
ncbi:MAG TPA: hypothetical protein VK184_25940 [Nostocaceae cyanobacterium]|nr:hypothetical protein [Nostocaceae cyanobacterium]